MCGRRFGEGKTFRKKRRQYMHNSLRIASCYGQLEVVKYLVEKGANIHADNNWVLKYTSFNGHLKVVKYLVDRGADIHAQNDDALRWASGHGHLEIVKYLVEKGASVNAENNVALRWASRNRHLEVVKFLIDKGGDKSVIPSKDKRTLLRYLALLVRVRNRKAIVIQKYYRAYKLNF